MIKWLVPIWKLIKKFIKSHFSKGNTTVQAGKTNISATASEAEKIEQFNIGDINVPRGSTFIYINNLYYAPTISSSRIEDTSKEIEGVKHPHKSAEEAAKWAEAERHFTQALTCYNKGDLDRAIEEFTKSIAAKKTPEAYNNRGTVWADKGEFDKAIADYNKAIELNPKDAGAYYNRGLAWGMKRELDKAIADFDRVIELDPKNAGYYLRIANALIALRDFPGAIERLRQGRNRNAFENDRDRLIASCLEGIALALSGQDASAAETKAKQLQVRGVRASDWDTEPIDRFLNALNPEDFAPGAVETARRFQEMLKSEIGNS